MFRVYRKTIQQGREAHQLLARFTFIESAQALIAAEADAGRQTCWIQYEPDAIARLASLPIPLRQRAGRAA